MDTPIVFKIIVLGQQGRVIDMKGWGNPPCSFDT